MRRSLDNHHSRPVLYMMQLCSRFCWQSGSRSLFSPAISCEPQNRSFPTPETSAAWSRKLSGDVDCIVLKALAKNMDHRFESVSELASDIARYLQGRPIVARKPGPIIKLAKFVRRQPVISAATSVLVVCSLVGLVLGVLAFQRIVRERNIASASDKAAQEAVQSLQEQLAKTELARMRAAGIGVYFSNVLTSASPDRLGRDATVVDALKLAANTFEETFEGDRATRFHVMEYIAYTFLQLGELQDAEKFARKRLKHYQAVLGEEHPQAVEALQLHFQCLFQLQQHADAENAGRKLIRLAKKIVWAKRSSYSDCHEQLCNAPRKNERIRRSGNPADGHVECQTRNARRKRPQHTQNATESWLPFVRSWANIKQASKTLRRSCKLMNWNSVPSHPETLIAQEAYLDTLASLEPEKAATQEQQLRPQFQESIWNRSSLHSSAN